MTPPPEASAASVSEPAGPAPSVAPPRPDEITPAPGELIRPAVEIFDRQAVAAEFAERTADTDDAREIRTALVEVLRVALDRGRAAIAEAFTARPLESRPTVAAYTYLTDCIIQTALHVATTRLHPCPNPTEGQQIALLALGGYGRAQMAPYSDVDLLFLIPWKKSGWTESLVESMLYVLWDLHLKVGHATRSVRDCLRMGAEDMTVRTSLLEYRFLGGHQPLADELSRRLWSELFARTGREFVEAKLAERAQRHSKHGARYVVEPDVKEGKGGLRDLQTLYWIAKYVHGVRDPAGLVAEGTFTEDEFRRFARAEAFLLAVRCHLHLIAGRAQDQLTFDMQVEVARSMGYEDTSGRPAVEHFMQDYFRHATRVGELTRIVLVAIEERHGRKAPPLATFLRRRPRVKPPFGVLRGRLTVKDEAAFLADNINMLRIFDEGLRSGLMLHPAAMRLIAANLDRIDDELRARPEANRIFLGMLLRRGNPERALRRMNELGALAAFLPEFAPVVAMMQFNMYHHFTVDEHTIQCISHLAKIERGELEEELPVASAILRKGETNRRVLYVALLLHDIGKGRAEDHSVLGARIARRVCPRLGLKPEECEVVEWLVRHHLLMSDMAQKRDLSDPRTVRDFARAVKTVRRLDLLTVLTVCDIRGVGPGVWNNWKAQLLRSLHQMTTSALETGLEEVNREAREAEAKRRLREALDDWPRAELRTETQRHYGPYWQGLPTAAHVVFARLLRGIGERRHRHGPDGRRGTRRDPRLLRHGRPSGHLLAPGRGAGAVGRQRGRRAHLHHQGRLRDRLLLGPGRRRPPLRRRAPAAAAPAHPQDARGRGRGARRAGAEGQDPQARACLQRAHLGHLRQRGVGHLHHRRGRHPRPPGPALRPDPHPGRRQRPDLQRGHRHLRRAGGRQLLRQGHVRAEAALGKPQADAREAPARGGRGRRQARPRLIPAAADPC